jgi:ABC-2 type transport system ATP-binding protein
MMVLETENLTKYYKNRIGCKNVTVSVNTGEIFGFLGPNGAGKSTFIKLLTGLLFPTSGKAFILGKPAGDVATRKKIGYLPENFKYQDWMSGEELLSFHGALYKIPKTYLTKRINEVLELVKLREDRKYRIGNYSKGMQQRIGIASALLPDPDLLFLDEPSSALDPIGRKEVREIMLHLKRQGKTIFLNSHLLSEVEMVCDSIAIINKGSIIKQGKMDDILESSITIEIAAGNINEKIRDELLKIDGTAVFTNDSIRMKVVGNEQINKAASIIINNGGRLYELKNHRENLESVFINLIEGREE